MFDFIGRRRIWFAISLAIILVGMGFWAAKGLNIGIDFRGGNLLELSFSTAQTTSTVRDVFTANGLTDASIQVIGEGGHDFLIRTQHVSEEARQKLYNDLRTACGEFQEVRFESVSPLIGKELIRLAILATAIANVGMLIYIWWRFEFRFAVAGIIALIHDVLITIAFFAIFRWTVDSTFIAALLTVVGYSINDTIVVYDRIREKLQTRTKGQTYDALANEAINETLRRSLLTTLTTVVAIAALLVFGGATIKPFALALVIGITSGAYSSIFIASPIWTMWHNADDRRHALASATGDRRADSGPKATPAAEDQGQRQTNASKTHGSGRSSGRKSRKGH